MLRNMILAQKCGGFTRTGQTEGGDLYLSHPPLIAVGLIS